MHAYTLIFFMQYTHTYWFYSCNMHILVLFMQHTHTYVFYSCNMPHTLSLVHEITASERNISTCCCTDVHTHVYTHYIHMHTHTSIHTLHTLMHKHVSLLLLYSDCHSFVCVTALYCMASAMVSWIYLDCTISDNNFGGTIKNYFDLSKQFGNCFTIRRPLSIWWLYNHLIAEYISFIAYYA